MGSPNGRRQRIRISELVQWTDRQKEAQAALRKHRFVLYGGARGGGKSRWLRWSLILFLIEMYKKTGLRGIHSGLFCETYKDLQDRQISKLVVEVPIWMGVVKSTQEDGLGLYLSPDLGGGILAMRNLDDPSKFQSAEFSAIGIDELTKNPKSTFDILRGSLRWSGIKRTLFLAGTNPGDIGHLWVKQLWIDRQFPPELEVYKNEFAFVQALPADNPYLDQQYWDDLNTLPEELRKAWVEGDWNVFAGQAFGTWSSKQHVIDPFEIPRHWIRIRGLDWGYAKPMCCLWGAIDPDIGRIYVYRELYEIKLTDRQQARMINSMTPPSETIRITYADPSLWTTKNVNDIVTTTADQYREEGIVLTRADNHRLNGKRKIDRLLMNLPDGKPGIQVFRGCENLVRTLPALPYDKTNVEDVDSASEDHCLIAGTIVTTSKGDIAIEKIKVGDRVLTRDGYKPVRRAWMTKQNAEVYRVNFSNGTSITGTAKHPVFVVEHGFISIDALQYDDIIIHRENVKCQNLLNLTELNTDDIQIQKTGRVEHISHQEEVIEKAVWVFYIRKFGRAFMEKFQKGIISTIQMATRLIMMFPISNVYPHLITCQNMRWPTTQMQPTWQELDRLPLHGTDRKKEESGIRSTQNNQNNLEQPCVLFVGRNFKQKCAGKIITAHLFVTQPREEKTNWTLSKKYAQCVGINSCPINITTRELAQDYVVRVCDVQKLNKPQDVYNLEIMDKHEFFANGVLVHNCYDSLKYLLTGVREKAPKQEVYKPHPLVAVQGL